MTEQLIIRDFQFTRDFRSIAWKATLWYNLLRAMFAGLAFSILNLMLPNNPNDSLLWQLSLPLIMPIGYLVLILPLALTLSALHWIPFVGLVSLILAFSIAVGDPFVCLLKKFSPSSVPVDDPALFSLTPVFWVLNAHEVSVAS